MLRVIVHYVPKSVVHMVLTIFYHNFFSYQFSVLFGIILVHIRCPQLFTTVVQNIFHNWCLPLINIFCFFDTPPDFVANHVPITLIRPLFPLCVPPPLWRGHVPKNSPKMPNSVLLTLALKLSLGERRKKGPSIISAWYKLMIVLKYISTQWTN